LVEIIFGEGGAIAREGSGVAADVDNDGGCDFAEQLNRIGVHARPWRVGDDDIGGAETRQLICDGANVFYVELKEGAVFDLIALGVGLSVLNGAFYEFDAENFLAVSRGEEGDRSGAAEEVVYNIIWAKLGRGEDLLIEGFCLRSIGLKEGVG